MTQLLPNFRTSYNGKIVLWLIFFILKLIKIYYNKYGKKDINFLNKVITINFKFILFLIAYIFFII